MRTLSLLFLGLSIGSLLLAACAEEPAPAPNSPVAAAAAESSSITAPTKSLEPTTTPRLATTVTPLPAVTPSLTVTPMPVLTATSLPPSPIPTIAGVPTPPAADSVVPLPTQPPVSDDTVDGTLQAFPLPPGSRPHDVAPAVDGGVWYTAQGSGELGWLDPETGETRHTRLGAGSRPHGVIVGPDGAPWVTDGGLNAIVRVDPVTLELDVFRLPPGRENVNLNTATFDKNGLLWFTGQSGVYGRLDPASGEMTVFDAPRGRGPYGIATSPNGDVYYASLAGSYVGHINPETGEATVLEPPTPNQGARRVWADSQGRIWVSEWNAGQVAVYDPQSKDWREWKLPGERPRAYAVYVDENDLVWLSDFGANAAVSFDPETEKFEVFDLPHEPGNVRQILGRIGEVWLPESAADQLVVVRYGTAEPTTTVGTTSSGTSSSEGEEGWFLRTIAPLGDERGLCIDLPGWTPTNINFDAPVQSHTCKHGWWNMDGRFDIAGLGEGRLEMPYFKRCLEAVSPEPGSRFFVNSCDGGQRQQFSHLETGQIVLSSSPGLCISIPDESHRDAGGDNFWANGLIVDTCSEQDADRQRWAFTEPL